MKQLASHFEMIAQGLRSLSKEQGSVPVLITLIKTFAKEMEVHIHYCMDK
jgi:hypothetical protein